jgi:putative hydrolase of the HAD superfamily
MSEDTSSGASVPARPGVGSTEEELQGEGLHKLSDHMDCLIFDLDDTIFDQVTYLAGAFAAAAAECGEECAGRLTRAMLQVTAELGSSCGRIFDEALQREALAVDAPTLERMVRSFRAYQPEGLSCFPGVLEMLADLSRRWPLGLVTDGPVETQVAKVKGLGIERFFRAIVYSDSIGGRATRKPSATPYVAALEKLGVRPERAVYVGDNPTKDFVGARALGMRTVRVLTGEYRELQAEPGYEADFVLTSVTDLMDLLE